MFHPASARRTAGFLSGQGAGADSPVRTSAVGAPDTVSTAQQLVSTRAPAPVSGVVSARRHATRAGMPSAGEPGHGTRRVPIHQLGWIAHRLLPLGCARSTARRGPDCPRDGRAHRSVPRHHRRAGVQRFDRLRQRSSWSRPDRSIRRVRRRSRNGRIRPPGGGHGAVEPIAQEQTPTFHSSCSDTAWAPSQPSSLSSSTAG